MAKAFSFVDPKYRNLMLQRVKPLLIYRSKETVGGKSKNMNFQLSTFTRPADNEPRNKSNLSVIIPTIAEGTYAKRGTHSYRADTVDTLF
jgi:hypothetical protein